ncbi:hypothetical protein AAG570_002527 [Ranatra chinensis]|uniref:WSC domain-containing protein n=1 Tax=Ranatra chinensis TaxID=642074 RepID=A0ABD0YK19_9HEMI
MYPTYKMRADEDDCSRPCDGNEKENCGGDYRLSVFDSLDTSGNQVQNLYTGCFVDSMENRVLRGAKKEDKKLNTPDFCAGFCYKGGFTYAGVQYGAECFCGDSAPQSAKVTDSDCNTACAGDSSIKCGGQWRLSIYKTSGRYKLLSPRLR